MFNVKGSSFFNKPLWGLLATIAATTVVTAALAPIRSEVGLLNEGLLLLSLTLFISAAWGWRVGLFAAVVTNLTLNFFFVEPLHQFRVHEPRSILALGVFLAVSLTGGWLLAVAQRAAAAARRRQAETEALLELSREMIGQRDAQGTLQALCSQLVDAFDARGASVLGSSGEDWSVLAWAGAESARRAPDREEHGAAERAVAQRTPSSLGFTDLATGRRPRIVLPGSFRGIRKPVRNILFMPLRVGDTPLGVLRLDGPIGQTPFRDRPERLLGAFAGEAALALHRVELARLAVRAAALQQADEMKSALMTSVSHDLKTPLASIKTAVSSLLDRGVAWSPEDVEAFLQTIDSQTDQLDRLISDILDLNRIESGTLTPERRPVEVRHLLEEANERALLATSGRRVEVTAPQLSSVFTDELLTVQALVNLIENAAKYSKEGGDIRLGAQVLESTVELWVEDDGPGIAPEDLPHVFERFYRAGDRSRRVKGSGLGLAIVKGFVNLCGGEVRVESSPDRTRFIVSLPVAQKGVLTK
jgi:two-component system sensor histidine kinase KdpD